MNDNKFNNYNLTNDEISKILGDYENMIHIYTSKLGKYQEDCEHEIIFQICKALTKNRKNNKI